MGDDDPIARLRAEMDQARASMKEFAGSLWALYSDLLDQGFDQDKAFKLTATWLAEMIRNSRGGEDD